MVSWCFDLWLLLKGVSLSVLLFDLRLEGLQAPVTRSSDGAVVETLWVDYNFDM